MNQSQFEKIKMYRVVLAVCLKYLKLVESVPAFLRAYQLLAKGVTAIEKNHTVQSANTKGVTLNKEQLRDSLIDTAMYIAGAVHSFGAETSNSALKAKIHVNVTDFKNCSFEEFIKQCDIIANEASAVIDKLADHGVSSSDVDAFVTLVSNFKVIVTKPREIIVEKSVVTEEILGAVASADKILKETTDKLIYKFKASGPSFFQEYWNARIIEGNGHRAAKTDSATPPVTETK